MTLTASSIVNALAERVLEQNPMHRPFLESSLAGLSSEEVAELEGYVGFCEARGVALDYLAESYNLIVVDTIKEQIYFKRHGRYRHSNYADLADEVYHNPEYMAMYMYGLAVTLFFWSVHRELKRFFRETLPCDRHGAYLEIGPGHGFYFMQAMQQTAYDSFLAVDISETSVAMTRDIVSSGYFGDYDAYALQVADFFDAPMPDAPYDAVVMGEVLEHVEQPERFLQRIHEISAPDAYIYVSTCINAPTIDHIALFESVDHLAGIIDGQSLAIAEQCVVPYQGLTLDEAVEKRMPINVAFTLKHAD